MKELKTLFIAILVSSIDHAQDTIDKDYPNTKQRWEIVYNEGEKSAETIYYSSGDAWMTAKYDTGKREYWSWYHKNGNLFFKATIIDNKLEGVYRIWYENGQLAEQLNFKSQLEEGPAKFYHPNGQLAMSGQYREGEMIGEWRFFDESGCPASGEWKWFFAALPDELRLQGCGR